MLYKSQCLFLWSRVTYIHASFRISCFQGLYIYFYVHFVILHWHIFFNLIFTFFIFILKQVKKMRVQHDSRTKLCKHNIQNVLWIKTKIKSVIILLTHSKPIWLFHSRKKDILKKVSVVLSIQWKSRVSKKHWSPLTFLAWAKCTETFFKICYFVFHIKTKV